MIVTLEEVIKATGGRLLAAGPSAPFTDVATDTRALKPGSLYVPLRGARFDGHDFLQEAVRSGAAGLLVARDDVTPPRNVSAVRVEDTLAAYGDLARHWRGHLGLQVIAVTGSSGKTSTKELIAALLARFIRVAKSHANYNNEIGVPKTLLSMTPSDEACVLEMGMRGPGEIAYLASVARPDIGVITNVGTAHIGRLGTQEAIAKAKGELLRVGGPSMTAVLNADDPYVMAQGLEHLGQVVTYSRLSPRATVWAEGEGRTFTIAWAAGERQPAGETRISLPWAGPHHQSNALAAVAVAWGLGIRLPEAITLAPDELPGRARVVTAGDLTIVDETYNANPESVLATIAGFCAEPSPGRRLVVLGEMAELGAYAEAGHRSVGTALRDAPVDRVFTVGEMTRWIAEQAPAKSEWFADQEALKAALIAELRPGDRVLVKGSRSARMEEVVAALEARYGETPA
jgi:UDP-N-acetylmuramoyl-tripeptide--D-alanyl-D-alanine ligase